MTVSVQKVEEVGDRIFRNRSEAEKVLFEYIEVFYNRKRKHSFLGMKSPEHFEKLYAEGRFKNVA